jgi:glycosyltransferase involved in cell wall biosynthesis
VLLLIPSVAKRGIEEDVASNCHPTMDYYALQAQLGADIADYAVIEADPHPLVRAARRGSRDVALALHGFLRRRIYDVIYSNGENVSIPLAALLRTVRRRPGHVLIGHHLSPKKKRPFLRALHPQMDAIFVYARTQLDYAVRELGIPERKLHLIPFHADARFYHPMEVPERNMICSAGLEWRDYPTMIEAVRGLDVEVRLAAASPWSRHRNETEKRELPPNVEARRYSYYELRQLYAESRFVVVPLYDNDFQAGVTTLLEAMAMGKAVIATRTLGQRDVIEDGVNGLYVPPGDAAAMRAAIMHLLAHPEEAKRLAANARRTIEERMSLDHWAARIARAVRSLTP